MAELPDMPVKLSCLRYLSVFRLELFPIMAGSEGNLQFAVTASHFIRIQPLQIISQGPATEEQE